MRILLFGVKSETCDDRTCAPGLRNLARYPVSTNGGRKRANLRRSQTRRNGRSQVFTKTEQRYRASAFRYSAFERSLEFEVEPEAGSREPKAGSPLPQRFELPIPHANFGQRFFPRAHHAQLSLGTIGDHFVHPRHAE